MPYRDAVWGPLERWSSTAFLAAGGLFVLPTVAFGLEATTDVGIGVSPAAVFLFLLVAFVGLLGLYPALAERGSTLALGGLGLLGATAAVLVSTLVVATLPLGPTLGESTLAALVLTVAIGVVLTVTAFGVASLRTGAHPRSVGASLLVTGAGVSLMSIAILLSGHTAPAWVSFVVNGLVATCLGASGYALERGDVPTDTTDPTDDVATS